MTITASEAKQHLFGLLAKTIGGHMPIKITSKAGGAVLISEEDYEGLLETLELLSAKGMPKSIRKAKVDIKAGRTKSLKAVFGR